jgi:Ca2+-transporting ATPase
MVTGDHPETAEEVARLLGLLKGPSVAGEHITGKEFGAMSDEKAEKAVKLIRILSRALPEHKERLVKLLRKVGHVVAVTGDGVNDAPAMKHANVALAMGSGTDVAKECSQVVLLNDSFATIKSAVMWGRTLYQNIQRFIVFQLTVNVAALGVAFLGPFIGVDIPLTVIQLLWVNLIMDTFAALALATEPPHEDVMTLSPRNPDAFIVTKEMSKWIFGFGFAFLIFLILALLHIKTGGVDAHELSLFFAVFVMLQFWNLFNARCFGLNQSALNGFWENKGFMVIAGVMFVGTIAMVQMGGEVLRTQPLTISEWAYITAGTSIVLWIGELVRFIGRVRNNTLRAER